MSDANINGHINGNGNGAIIRSRNGEPANDPRAENSAMFYKLRDEELQALTDKGLSHGAARLFCLLSKLCWFPEAGGYYRGKKGVIAISLRDLARKCTGNLKSINRWKKNLIERNYVWITKHQIPNIPEDKALNVYHFCCLEPSSVQTNLSFDQGSWGDNAHDAHSVFSAPEPNAHSQTAKTDTDSAQNGTLPVRIGTTARAQSDALADVQERTARAQPSALAVVPSTTGNGHLEPQPVRINGHGQESPLGHNKKTLEINQSTEPKKGGSNLPIPVFQDFDWKMFPGKRTAWGEKHVEYLKEKIYGLENSRKPATNRAEVIAVYKQRIRDTKKWMAGEVTQ